MFLSNIATQSADSNSISCHDKGYMPFEFMLKGGGSVKNKKGPQIV